MNEKHIYMFLLGIFLHDIKDILAAGTRYAINKLLNRHKETQIETLLRLLKELEERRNEN